MTLLIIAVVLIGIIVLVFVLAAMAAKAVLFATAAVAASVVMLMILLGNIDSKDVPLLVWLVPIALLAVWGITTSNDDPVGKVSKKDRKPRGSSRLPG